MAARTAVVAGTATAVSGRVARRQAARYEGQAQAAPMEAMPEAPAPAADDTAAQLQQLAALRDQGILTEEEFTAKKQQILGI
ncbi:MAG TPA: SHOCT domain-containing protein [Actinomycetota bacterium]